MGDIAEVWYIVLEPPIDASPTAVAEVVETAEREGYQSVGVAWEDDWFDAVLDGESVIYVGGLKSYMDSSEATLSESPARRRVSDTVPSLDGKVLMVVERFDD